MAALSPMASSEPPLQHPDSDRSESSQSLNKESERKERSPVPETLVIPETPPRSQSRESGPDRSPSKLTTRQADHIVELVFKKEKTVDELYHDDEPEDGAIHKNWTDSGLRAAIFGFSDGLVTSISLISGVYLAYTGSNFHDVVVVTGVAGMVAGGCSMFCGEWISITAQNEAERYEVDREKKHLLAHPVHESEHMTQILMGHGLSKGTCREIIKDLSNAPIEKQLNLHARLELGIDPEGYGGSALKAGSLSFVMFILGAIIPIIPWFVTESKEWGFWSSIIVSLVMVIIVAMFQAKFSPKNPWLVCARQVSIVVAAVGLSLLLNWAITGQVA